MPKATTRTVLHGETEIRYTLQRKRVKNINLRIRPDGSVSVSAPRLVTVAQIDRFVLSKGDYILGAMQKFAEMPKETPLRYETGEKLSILGKEVTLRVTLGKMEGAILDGDTLILTVKEGADAEKKQRLVKKCIDTLCKDVFGEIVAGIHPEFVQYGLALPTLKIRDMKSRWGSCLVHKGTITLNRRLIEKPVECIRYVAVHEYCHFIHPNHSGAFYALLEKHLPNWKEIKGKLNK